MKPKILLPSELQEQQKKAKKKSLDNFYKKMYNTLGVSRGVNPCVGRIEDPCLDFSYNRELTLESFEVGYSLLKKVNEVAENYNIPAPILSGGSIRDAFLGLPLKDYDIFFDLTNTSDGILEAADCFQLFAEEVGTIFGYTPFKKPLEEYGNRTHEAFVLWDLVEEGETLIQLIGHKNTKIVEDPLSFTDNYPYNLIQNCLTVEGDLLMSEKALEGFKNKSIKVLGEVASHKAEDFFYKVRSADPSWTFINPSWTFIKRTNSPTFSTGKFSGNYYGKYFNRVEPVLGFDDAPFRGGQLLPLVGGIRNGRWKVGGNEEG